MPECPFCKKDNKEHTVEPVYDLASGVMFAVGKPSVDTKFKCSNGHTWEELPED